MKLSVAQMIGRRNAGLPSPLAILGADLGCWLRGDVGVTYGSGTCTAADGSGNGLDFSAGSNAPTNGNPINGRATIGFNGTTNILGATSFPTSWPAIEGFLVCKYRSDPSGVSKGIWRIGTGSPSFTPFSNGLTYENFGTTVRKDSLTLPYAMHTAARVLNVRSATDAWSAWLDNTNFATVSGAGSNTVGISSTPNIGGNPSFFCDMDVGELILCKTVITTPQRTAINAWLHDRWAVTIN